MSLRNLSRCLLVLDVVLAMLMSAACRAQHRDQASLKGHVDSIGIELPASLEPERNVYERDVATAMGDVSRFFRVSGFALGDQRIIDSVTVFDSVSKAREYMAKAYGVPLDGIPETFSGTVDGRVLFLVSRESYRQIWQQLYSEWPWSDSCYHQLIIHELAHRAHEEVAIARFGSAEGMGPTWFFEGLAVTCAGQFETAKPLLSLEQLKDEVGPGHTPEVSYPLYGRIVRSLAAKYEMKVMMTKASEPGFPETLWSSPVHSKGETGESPGKVIEKSVPAARTAVGVRPPA